MTKPDVNKKGTNEKDIEYYQLVDSTNIIAQQIAEAAAEANTAIPHGKVIIAEQQSAGRGRYGRSFYSPPGSGIYMSFVLSPDKLALKSPALITCYTAVAVCRAIEEVCKKSPRIKWVNDLFIDGKKICGISAETDAINWIVVGIGINLRPDPNIPKELLDIIGAVYGEEEISCWQAVKSQLIDTVIENMLSGDTEDIIGSYRRRLFILGKRIRVEGALIPFEALAVDVDDMGHLIAKDDAGLRHVLRAGEIGIKL